MDSGGDWLKKCSANFSNNIGIANAMGNLILFG
jgi:hypothetical protein